MDTKMKIIVLASALGAWGLAVLLVIHMLSGTFDERTCQTVCMQNIYWASFGACVIGLIIGWAVIKQPRPNSILLANVLLSGLFLIYLVTMAIGTFT